ncbi:MAG: YggS family pyridoxal phosphate-dependent enzyme [Rickettsiales bacterium]|nr:YggS family pyridoxal phosphate-dependent enzyme [Rickettsiales bacterium]
MLQLANTSIQARLEGIQAAMAMACQRADRPTMPTLIAVSKRQPLDRIEALLALGHRHFGENQVQEAQEKWPELKQRYPDIVLHLIGPLQSNKVKQAVALFDVIHTIDREKIVDALVQETKQQPLHYLMQVNIGEEEQKAGIAPQQAETLWQYAASKGLLLSGLMAIPPAGEAPGPYFALLAQSAQRLATHELSMGMSDDFESAIRFGATYIRVGTALFGERNA